MITDIPILQRITCSISQAAQLLGISRSAIYELIAAGEIETVHIGVRCLVVVRSLVDLIGRRRAASTAVSDSVNTRS